MPKTIEVVVNDITTLKVDAIVNAANSRLQAGGGVCGAIFKAAGYRTLQKACDKLWGCPTGSAKWTKGYKLPAKYIIHAVGPMYTDGDEQDQNNLYWAYTSCFEIAEELGLTSIALPAISTGIYGYPLEDATKIALESAYKSSFRGRIIFCCFDAATAEVYNKLASVVLMQLEQRYKIN